MSALLPVIVASSHLVLVADTIPELKYEPSCRSAAATAAMQNRNEDASGCAHRDRQSLIKPFLCLDNNNT